MAQDHSPSLSMPAADPAHDQFSEFELYRVPGWDGYDALPIGLDTVAAARRLYQRFPEGVPEADIAPGADGSIGFEWRHRRADGIDLTLIEIGPGTTVTSIIVEGGHPRHTSWSDPEKLTEEQILGALKLVLQVGA